MQNCENWIENGLWKVVKICEAMLKSKILEIGHCMWVYQQISTLKYHFMAWKFNK